MKRFLFTLLIPIFFNTPVNATEQTIHPIDRDEAICRQNAQTSEDWTKCTYIATKAWNAEIDKYYSLLHKKLKGEQKTNFFENQKYWNMYKNHEIKLINDLYNKDNETKDRLIFRTNQKRDLSKKRAEALRLYYILTFSDDEQDKIQKNSEYNPDNVLMRHLRMLGF